MFVAEIRNKISDEISEYLPENFIEEVYDDIKVLTCIKILKSSHIEALAELFTELANRLKEEESCDK